MGFEVGDLGVSAPEGMHIPASFSSAELRWLDIMNAKFNL